MTYSTDVDKVILHTRHKTFCILPQPKFRLRKNKNLSKVSLHLSKFAIIESPISTNFALVDEVYVFTCFLNVLYQPILPFLANGFANGLIRGFIFNGLLINKLMN